MPPDKERNQTIDIAKGLGMIFVVLFHAQIIPELWVQFHMPLFAFLSGILYTTKNNDSIKSISRYAVKKIKATYIPFVVYNITFLCFHNILYQLNIYSNVHNGLLYSVNDYIKKVISIITLGGGESLAGPLWYLIAMLEFTLIYAVIRMLVKRLKSNKQKIVVTIICIIFLIAGYSSIEFPRMLNKAFVLLTFYHTGFMIKKHREIFLNQKRVIIIVVIVSFVLLILGLFSGVAWSNFSILSIPCGLIGIWLTMLIASFLDRFKKNAGIIFIGQHTMFILATHMLWFKVVTFLILTVNHHDISFLGTFGVSEGTTLGWKIVYFVCGIGMPILLVCMKERIVKICKRKLQW